MGNVRPFWRAIERERLGSGHSLAVRRANLAARRAGLRRESAKAERRSVQQNSAIPAKVGLFKSAWRRIVSYGKKISGNK